MKQVNEQDRLRHCCVYEPNFHVGNKNFEHCYFAYAEHFYVSGGHGSVEEMDSALLDGLALDMRGVGFMPAALFPELVSVGNHINKYVEVKPDGSRSSEFINLYLSVRKAKRAIVTRDVWQCSDGSVAKVDVQHKYRALDAPAGRLAECRIWNGSSLSKSSGDTYLDIFECAERAYVSGRRQTIRLMAQFESELGEPTADVDYALLLCMFEECRKRLAKSFSPAQFSAAVFRYEALPRNSEVQ